MLSNESWSPSWKVGLHWSLENLLQIWLASSPLGVKRWANNGNGRFCKVYLNVITKVLTIFVSAGGPSQPFDRLDQSYNSSFGPKRMRTAPRWWIYNKFACLKLSVVDFKHISECTFAILFRCASISWIHDVRTSLTENFHFIFNMYL